MANPNYKIKQVEVPCQYCGDLVERIKTTSPATCFNCKRQRQAVRAVEGEYAKKSHLARKLKVIHSSD